MTNEERRLEETRRKRAHWQRWGPYVSERARATVREDYTPCGSAWAYLPHDHARSRAYRWNEDGIAGMTGEEGNHAEDVRECYFYLDSTPTHS